MGTLRARWTPARVSEDEYRERGIPMRRRDGNCDADRAASGLAAERAVFGAWRARRAAALADLG
eukprot:7202129-Lingulodinium_polyedra.AAC.1